MPDVEAQLAAKLEAARQEQHEGWTPERLRLRLRRRAESACATHERAQARLAVAEEQRALAQRGLDEASEKVESTAQRLAEAEAALELCLDECRAQHPPREEQERVPDKEAASTLRRLLASPEGRRLVSEITAGSEPARKRNCTNGLDVPDAAIG